MLTAMPVDIDLVSMKTFSLLHCKANIKLPAGLWSWFGFSSHAGAIVDTYNLEIRM
jgi:hypothetical protein